MAELKGRYKYPHELYITSVQKKIDNDEDYDVNNNNNRTPGRPRRRWEDNIKLDIQEVGRGGMDWIVLAQDRDRWRALVNEVTNLRVP